MIALINQATGVTDAEAQAVAAALQIQLRRDFRTPWDVKERRVVVATTATGAWPIYLLDNADVAGALGYHDFTSTGPVAKVFVATSKQYGVSWSSVASHEMLEMLADPEIVLAALDYKTATFYAYETCDAVEAQSYLINGIEVSNFVYPSWFAPDGKPPYDQLGSITAPFTLARANGQDYISTIKVSGGWTEVTARRRVYLAPDAASVVPLKGLLRSGSDVDPLCSKGRSPADSAKGQSLADTRAEDLRSHYKK